MYKALLINTFIHPLKVKLDASADRERMLKAKRDEYIACHNRQLAEKHEFEEKLAEFNRKKEAAVEKKTEECFALRRKMQGKIFWVGVNFLNFCAEF